MEKDVTFYTFKATSLLMHKFKIVAVRALACREILNCVLLCHHVDKIETEYHESLLHVAGR